MSRKGAHPADRDIGQRVRVRRLELGLSQQRLGSAIGVTFQQVQKYERGTNRIGAGRLQQIAKVLDVPVAYFFDETAGSPRGTSVVEFLQTAHSLRLLRAFSRIQDRKKQLSIVELVEQVAGPDGAPV